MEFILDNRAARRCLCGAMSREKSVYGRQVQDERKNIWVDNVTD